MKNKDTVQDGLSELRRQAEKMVSEGGHPTLDEIPLESAQRLIVELQVHQIELEMQNDELRKTQDQLGQEREKYADLYNFAPVAYFIFDQRDIILDLNMAAAELLGSDRRYLIDHPLTAYITPESLQIFVQHRQNALETRAPQTCELILRPRHGEPASVQTRTVALQAAEGAQLWRSVMTDITERKRSEAEIRRLNDTLEQRIEDRTRELREAQEKIVQQEKLSIMGELANSVGHELRNPLTVINNAVYYLTSIQPDASEKVKQYHQIMKLEVWNASKIINNLLDFGSAVQTELAAVSISELINQALRRNPPPDGIEVLQTISNEPPKVHIDPQQMTQVFGHLLQNAYQAIASAGASGGKVGIAAAAQNDMVCVQIQDNGIGIPPENIGKLFDPLFTTNAKSMGLGLALCDKLIKANEGKIEIKSESGKGATFTVYMPLEKPPSA